MGEGIHVSREQRAAVIMAQFRCKSSGKSGSRRVWGQRPGRAEASYFYGKNFRRVGVEGRCRRFSTRAIHIFLEEEKRKV